MSILAGIGAGVGAGVINWMSGDRTNAANSDMSAENRRWQKMMSDSAHQREVSDLKRAGLNPILSAGGNGSSTPSGGAPNLVAPQVQMPDMLAYGISLKQLEQADQKIAIDKANSSAAIAKSLSDTDLNKMKKILAQKGMIRADLEGEASTVIQKMIKWMKGSATKNQQPKSTSEPTIAPGYNSSFGNIPLP